MRTGFRNGCQLEDIHGSCEIISLSISAHFLGHRIHFRGASKCERGVGIGDSRRVLQHAASDRSFGSDPAA
jgi:hypothetical protein